MHEFRFAIRSLLKTPIVTAIAVLSVALGIGANVAIFSMFNSMLLRPLPVHEPERLVNFVSPGPRNGTISCGQAGTCDAIFSYPMFRDLERVQTVFTGIAAHRDFGANIAYGGVSEGGDCALVSGSYFPVLGLTPQIGRLLNPDDDREPGSGRVVVLSYDYWRRRFGERADVIGQSIVVNGQALAIVGVAPRGFHGTTTARPSPHVRADLDARGDRSAMERARQQTLLLGLPVRAAETRHRDRAGARHLQRSISIDPHAGRCAHSDRECGRPCWRSSGTCRCSSSPAPGARAAHPTKHDSP